ncbi:MAG: ABC transporter ATP-binding protein [Chloroflexota bacterium]
MARPNPAILVENLTKRYGSKRVIDDLSFQVQKGEIFALLGPNGAGKTTTVEILEGYRSFDHGCVEVLGARPAERGGGLKTRVGAMPQEGGLYPAISPRGALTLFASFYDRPRPVDEMLDLVSLRDAEKTRYRRLSGGQKQRLSLALALIGRPELVFLDEPTAGLDPQARRATWDIILRLRDESVTVVLTTHYLEEAERLADRVAIIDHGRLVALGTPEDLARAGAPQVRLRTAAPVDVAALAGLPSVRAATMDDTEYVVETADPATLLVEVTTWLRAQGVSLLELHVGQASLEEVFLRVTGHEFQP